MIFNHGKMYQRENDPQKENLEININFVNVNVMDEGRRRENAPEQTIDVIAESQETQKEERLTPEQRGKTYEMWNTRIP